MKKFTGKEEVFETFYKDLIRDPKYKYNNLLQFLKEDSSFRKEVFRMSIMDGLKNESSSKGTKFMKLDHKDFIFTDLALFANTYKNEQNKKSAKAIFNNHVYLVGADKKLQMIFSLPTTPISLSGDELGVGENQPIHNKFRNVVSAEIARMKSAVEDKTKLEEKDLQIHYHYKKGSDPKSFNGLAYQFLSLPSMNKHMMGKESITKRILDYITENPNSTVDNIIENFAEDIDLAVTKSLNVELKKQLNLLEKYNLIEKVEGGYNNKSLPSGFVKLN